MGVLDSTSMCSGSILDVEDGGEVRRLEFVPRVIYFLFCNELHVWTIRAIPTYRDYRLYDTKFFCFSHVTTKSEWSVGAKLHSTLSDSTWSPIILSVRLRPRMNLTLTNSHSPSSILLQYIDSGMHLKQSCMAVETVGMQEYWLFIVNSWCIRVSKLSTSTAHLYSKRLFIHSIVLLMSYALKPLMSPGLYCNTWLLTMYMYGEI